MMAEQDSTSAVSPLTVLIALLVGTVALVSIAVAWTLGRILPHPGIQELQVVLTNMATIGGIVSGLSLAGFSILLAGSKGIQAMTEQYGHLVHWLFLLTYALTVVSSIACAVVSGSDDFSLMIWTAAVSASLMITGVVLTALLINSIFGWIRSTEYTQSS